MTRKVKVLLVDDSRLILSILTKLISADKRLEVIGAVTSGQEALEVLEREHPDIICTDYHMPRMNGLQFTRAVMATRPTPILVISISVQEDQTANIFQLLEAGAVEVFPKPRAGARFNEAESKQLCDRIYVVSRVHVYKSMAKRAAESTPVSVPKQNVPARRLDLVLMGGSTGAPQIYFEILSQLKLTFVTPIVAVQHISTGFIQSFVDWLDRSCNLTVKIAEHNEPLRQRHVYFPPDGAHILIVNGCIHLDYEIPPNCGSRPSVNVLYQSIANNHRAARTLAILLSGMGRDGADGMEALHNKGGYTIAQSEDSCAIFGMPGEAVALQCVDQVLPPSAIADFMNQVI